ncbi:MAG TPA: hypothetical protein PLO67_10010 [Saprospiraceae bacterium]|nr:hypothetical protein [Saprospiraceae bacterium]HPI06219.1 hypothetical protein [Saprospiraceae bacterium]
MTLNSLPSLLAALLVEAGEHSLDQISIHAADGPFVPALRQILHAKKDRDGQRTRIRTRSKRPESLALEQEMPADHPFLAMKTLFEQETSRLQIEQCLYERRQILGQPTLHTHFFHETDSWENPFKKIFAFFLPYGSQISGHTVLIEKCLSAALGEAVRVKATFPMKRFIPGGATGNMLVGSTAKVGGIATAVMPGFLILIGPVAAQHLKPLAPGSRMREFLEKALLLLFLPGNSGWEIRIETAPDVNKCRLGTAEKPMLLQINSTI